MNDKIGTCCICGEQRPLTYEHVPPRAAFNADPVVSATIEQSIGRKLFDKIQGKTLQRGAGGRTLCQSCNNNTGIWYAREYINWTYDAAYVLSRTDGSPQLTYPYVGRPLRFFKQVITMFMSVSGGQLLASHPHLRRYLLNPHSRNFDDKTLRVYAYYNPSNRFRQTGVTAFLDIYTGNAKVFHEFTAFPFGFVLTINSQPPDAKLTDITDLSHCNYETIRTTYLSLPSFPVLTAVPGQFHTMQQAQKMYEDPRNHSDLL